MIGFASALGVCVAIVGWCVLWLFVETKIRRRRAQRRSSLDRHLELARRQQIGGRF